MPSEATRLSARRLAADCGPKSLFARRLIPELYAAIVGQSAAPFAQWQAAFAAASGGGLDPARLAEAADGRRFGLPDPREHPTAILFALQSYHALVVECLTAALLGRDPGPLLRSPLFAWPQTTLAAAVHDLAAHMARYDREQLDDDPAEGGDLFRPLYENLFPRKLRHAQGEYYTPDWLVDLVLDEADYAGQLERRLLDPTCGSGGFLVKAIARALRATAGLSSSAGNAGEQATRIARQSTIDDPPAVLRRILSSVVGFELQPLAALAARANYLLAIRRLPLGAAPIEIPVHCRDLLLDPPDGAPTFDCVVGNPPWVAWDHLPPAYRQATQAQWQRYGLFSLSARDARHGGAKKDLSMLVTCVAADRCLRDGGRLAFVITQTVFQTKGAGDGFRRFRLGPAGPPLRVLRVHELTALRPFPEAANWTSTLALEKGAATEYPVPYEKWTPGAAGGPPVRRVYRAEPVDPLRPGSPWILAPSGWNRSWRAWLRPAAYQAHLGANTAGANGVYWLTVLGVENGLLRVRNDPGCGKRTAPAVETLLEPDLLYPLLRWGDVARYCARPAGHILLAQDPVRRRGCDEAELVAQQPRTWAYLNGFRELLERRAAYRRYQERAAFYSMYNVGPYTVAPVKVVWRRMTRRIEAAVVEPHASRELPARPVVPQETCVLVDCADADEAHYLCAVLNSSPVEFLVQAYSVTGGKGFGTPGMMDYLPIDRYEPADEPHRRLAALSREAHAGGDLTAIDARVDELVAALWQLTPDELTAIWEELGMPRKYGVDTPPG